MISYHILPVCSKPNSQICPPVFVSKKKDEAVSGTCSSGMYSMHHFQLFKPADFTINLHILPPHSPSPSPPSSSHPRKQETHNQHHASHRPSPPNPSLLHLPSNLSPPNALLDQHEKPPLRILLNMRHPHQSPRRSCVKATSTGTRFNHRPILLRAATAVHPTTVDDTTSCYNDHQGQPSVPHAQVLTPGWSRSAISSLRLTICTIIITVECDANANGNTNAITTPPLPSAKTKTKTCRLHISFYFFYSLTVTPAITKPHLSLWRNEQAGIRLRPF